MNHLELKVYHYQAGFLARLNSDSASAHRHYRRADMLLEVQPDVQVEPGTSYDRFRQQFPDLSLRDMLAQSVKWQETARLLAEEGQDNEYALQQKRLFDGYAATHLIRNGKLQKIQKILG